MVCWWNKQYSASWKREKSFSWNSTPDKLKGSFVQMFMTPYTRNKKLNFNRSSLSISVPTFFSTYLYSYFDTYLDLMWSLASDLSFVRLHSGQSQGLLRDKAWPTLVYLCSYLRPRISLDAPLLTESYCASQRLRHPWSEQATQRQCGLWSVYLKWLLFTHNNYCYKLTVALLSTSLGFINWGYTSQPRPS